MENIRLPDRFVKHLFEFRGLFTAPTFEYFQVIISGLLLGQPKKAITKAVRLAGLEDHFWNVHRTVSQYRWDPYQLGLTVLGLVLRTLGLCAPLTFGLDSSLVSKYGQKIFGCGFHFNHARKPNQAQYIWGHDWIVMGLIWYAAVFEKWLCFPFLARLFVPEKSLPEGATYQSRVEIAADMVRRLKGYLKQPFILVADGAFAKRHLLRTCISEEVTLISRLQRNAVLYEAPKAGRKRTRGRPRKYGDRLPPLSTLAQRGKGFETYRLRLYGKEREVRVKQICGLWKPAGQIVQVLIVYYEKAKKPAFFFATDLSLSVQEMLVRVAARWSLETLFRDAKEHLGFEDWQCSTELAVNRSIPLTCVATSLLMLWSYEEAMQDSPELWDPVPWYSRKTTPSMADMIYQLRSRTISATILSILKQRRRSVEKSASIRRLLRNAA